MKVAVMTSIGAADASEDSEMMADRTVFRNIIFTVASGADSGRSRAKEERVRRNTHSQAELRDYDRFEAGGVVEDNREMSTERKKGGTIITRSSRSRVLSDYFSIARRAE